MWSTSSFRGRYSSYNFLALSVARARSSSACLIVASICKHSTLFHCGFHLQTHHSFIVASTDLQTHHTVSLWRLSANTQHCLIVASICKHTALFVASMICKHSTLFHGGFCLQTQHTDCGFHLQIQHSLIVIFICKHITLFDCFFHLQTQHIQHGLHLQTHSLRFSDCGFYKSANTAH